MTTHPAARVVHHLAHSAGRDFNEAIGLIEEYLKASVPQELLMNRPPNNPMEQYVAHYFGSFLTFFSAIPHPAPPTCNVLHTWCPWLAGADWCFAIGWYDPSTSSGST